MVTLKQIDAVAAMDDLEGVLRNQLITHCYWSLSNELRPLIGGVDASWWTFAVWASRQVGEFMHMGFGFARSRETVRALVTSSEPDQLIFAKAARSVALALARGNRSVFAEIALAARLFLDVASPGKPPSESQLQMISTATTHIPDSLLYWAFRAYGRAMTAPTERERALGVVEANYLIGIHEQNRLQPELEKAFTSPFAEPGASLITDFKAMVAAIVKSLREKTEDTYRELVTEYLAVFSLPGVRLGLGDDVPALNGQNFPSELAPLAETPQVVWGWYHGNTDDLAGTASDDWTDYNDRMRFITAVFRSRQRWSRLYDPPFSPPDMVEIEALLNDQTLLIG